MNLKEAVELTLEKYKDRSKTSQSTWRAHARRILSVIPGETELEKVTVGMVRRYMKARLTGGAESKPVSPATVCHELTFFSQVFAVVSEELDIGLPNPVKSVKKPKVDNARERILSFDEQERISKFLTTRDFTLIEFAIQTGMRRLEQFSLRPGDISFEDRKVGNKILRTGIANIRTSKTGKGRKCPLNPVAARIASNWLELNEGPWVFCGNNGGNRLWVGVTLARRLQRAAAKASIEGLRWHDLRHTCATRAVRAGASPREVQRLLGHKHLSETERYMAWSDQDAWPAALALYTSTSRN